jgi:2-oxoisovalerate dehydrogenase E2 component (dihydrolipoyl transacylase)
MSSKCRTWAKASPKPGDTVKEDQVLADVMTDKATVEIPSPVNGTVTSLGGKLGEAMAVGAELIRLEVEGAGNFKIDAKTPAQAVRNEAVAAAESAGTTAARAGGGGRIHPDHRGAAGDRGHERH